MEIIMEQIRLAMELLYYTCAPVLVVIGLIGLQQLRISKEARRISARRESLSLAADRCAHYTNYINWGMHLTKVTPTCSVPGYGDIPQRPG